MKRSLKFINCGAGRSDALATAEFAVSTNPKSRIEMRITALLSLVAVAAVLLCSHFPGDQALAAGCSAPSFAAERTFLPAAPRSVAAGDFDADGHLDLLVASEYTSEILAILGNGDATFQPPV